jgi:hypothetical protein
MSPVFTGTCQWGNCDKPTYGWRFDPASVQWLCVCDEHMKAGDIAITISEVEDLHHAQEVYRDA